MYYDTVVRDYANDPRIRYIEPNRMIQYADIVVVSTESLPIAARALQVDVFPIPATNTVSLVIDNPKAGPMRIDIFDIQGRRIAEDRRNFDTHFRGVWGKCQSGMAVAFVFGDRQLSRMDSSRGGSI